jgi:hypothetical protein
MPVNKHIYEHIYAYTYVPTYVHTYMYIYIGFFPAAGGSPVTTPVGVKSSSPPDKRGQSGGASPVTTLIDEVDYYRYV